ncbi:MAG: hypothetical protein IJR51_08720, partial [Clostridia bacterium]|nr:hypothetical protein [Clostridia bacterium]
LLCGARTFLTANAAQPSIPLAVCIIPLLRKKVKLRQEQNLHKNSIKNKVFAGFFYEDSAAT